ncbi:MAG: pyridoxine 5'-phosphate synthase [Saprospiraceae bacterium]
MTRLSVNINKIATLRNSRGGNLPDLVQAAQAIESFGAQGITVHPRPDQRHIRYDDVPLLRSVLTTEFNIEGKPDKNFIDLVLANLPHQCTLVPDTEAQLTSDHGWDTVTQQSELREVVQTLQKRGVRVSVFVDPDARMIEGAKLAGADRVEFYTGPFARDFKKDPIEAVRAYAQAAQIANSLGIGINAGHDLNLENLRFFKEHCPQLLEVSIGHALISDALYFGLENTVGMYLRQLN